MPVARAGEHAVAIPAVEWNIQVQTVSEAHFPAGADAVAVVRDGIALGLVTRVGLSNVLFARFGHALYGERPIERFADSEALAVHSATSLEDVLRLAFGRAEHRAYDDVIVVDDAGAYVGLLSVKRLVLHQTDLLAAERRRKAEVEARGRELAEIAEMKSRFLASLTHELRAPANTILGASELLEAHRASGRTDRIDAHLKTIRGAAAHLRVMIDNILDQAKLEAGRMQSTTERVSLRGLVEEVGSATRVLAPPVVVVRVEVPADDCFAETDAPKVRQILLNLASNASKFTESGEIELRLTRLPSGYELAVTDTGRGISEADQRLLFKPFTQLAKVETRRHGGTGLGLSISKALSERIGGELRLTSAVGKGTAAMLRLPRGAVKEKP